MAVSDDNQQVSVTLPKEIVKQVEKEAQKEMRTRSKQIAKIVIDHFKEDK